MTQERLEIFCRRKHERNNMHEGCHFLSFELFWIARRGNHCYRRVRPQGTQQNTSRCRKLPEVLEQKINIFDQEIRCFKLQESLWNIFHTRRLGKERARIKGRISLALDFLYASQQRASQKRLTSSLRAI